MDKRYILEKLNSLAKGTLMESLGIKFTDVGEDFLTGEMPVDHRTRQPFGILHGGATMALAETLGSAASMLITDMDKNIVVGMEVKGNHLKQVNEGFVTGKATPVHQGKLTHLWNVDIFNEANELTATCRITNIILEKEQG